MTYEPIVVGKTMYVGSAATDTLLALNTETGEERWRFFADGPLRFAPAAWQDRLFLTSDDGNLYCLRAADGELLWKFRGGPSERRIIGNGRLISAWPARGAPVIVENNVAGGGDLGDLGATVYFGASIWPFMGIFIYALDAESGSVVWANDGSGSMYIKQPHNSDAFAGMAPQGYLAAAGDRLLIPNGRSAPACLDRIAGHNLYFHLARNNRRENYHVGAIGDYLFNGKNIHHLPTGDLLAQPPALDYAFDEERLYSAAVSVKRKDEDAPPSYSLKVSAQRFSLKHSLNPENFEIEWRDPQRKLRYLCAVKDKKVVKVIRFEDGAAEGKELKHEKLKTGIFRRIPSRSPNECSLQISGWRIRRFPIARAARLVLPGIMGPHFSCTTETVTRGEEVGETGRHHSQFSYENTSP